VEEALMRWISHYGYAGIFSLLMFGIVGAPIPDETLLAFSGYLVFKGELGLFPTMLSAFLGSSVGVSISYSIGRAGGLLLIRRYGHKIYTRPGKLAQIHQWLGRFGKWGLTFGYFIPGVRHLTALAAGASRLKYPVFAAYAYSGVLVWSATFVAAGFFMAREWSRASAIIHRIALISVAAIVPVLLIYYFIYRNRHEKT
jgi:membrane protein DedA with SNARE-associated domain